MSKGQIDRLTVTVDEAAEMLGLSRASAYEAVRRGELPAIRMGRRWLVPLAALQSLLGRDVASAGDTE